MNFLAFLIIYLNGKKHGVELHAKTANLVYANWGICKSSKYRGNIKMENQYMKLVFWNIIIDFFQKI